MRLIGLGVCLALVAGVVTTAGSIQKRGSHMAAVDEAVDKAARWLASVQGADGGWGQDGGEAVFNRNGERLESGGNDLANTAVAVLALRRAGPRYQENVSRALAFILNRIETSPAAGLAITSDRNTQIQRKLGPYIDTFLTSMLLAEIEGSLPSPAQNARVRRALQKTVTKIQEHQLSDGSWNIAGGWAPVLGTSIASRSLYEARRKGIVVKDQVMRRAEDYTVQAMATGREGGAFGAEITAASAGVPLYQSAQALEQLTRTEADRAKNAVRINEIRSLLADASFVDGFGSIGGEEFFSYLNISDGLRRAGGDEWTKWHSATIQKILNMQNADGSWAGHHCITGRVAVTSAAILNLKVDDEN